MLLRGGRCVDRKGRHVILLMSVLNRNSECKTPRWAQAWPVV